MTQETTHIQLDPLKNLLVHVGQKKNCGRGRWFSSSPNPWAIDIREPSGSGTLKALDSDILVRRKPCGEMQNHQDAWSLKLTKDSSDSTMPYIGHGSNWPNVTSHQEDHETSFEHFQKSLWML